ncbi:MAG: hypothetical protein JJ878_16235 [Alphaproteobacteria bacterium]|nr:hypothetical protein [Alphaproteobacteria bacterium]
MLVLHWIGKGGPPEVDGVSFSTEDSPSGAFQAVACHPSDLYLDVGHQSTPSAATVAPLVVFGDLDPRVRVHVDVWVQPGEQDSLERIRGVVNRIWKRLNNRLCKAASDSAHIAVLALAYSRQTSLAPEFDPSDPTVARFPGLLGHSDLEIALQDLHAAGLMTRSATDTLPQCPQCEGSRALAREVCVFCGKATLEKSTIVHHYRCGYQGPEDDFEREGEDGWHCPKCHHELRHYGRDYDQSGNLFVCLSCNGDMTEPEVGFRCLDCGTDTRGDRMGFRRIWRYELTPNATMALTLLRDGKEDRILDLLRGGGHSSPEGAAVADDRPGPTSARTFKLELSLADGGDPTDLADGYEIVHSVLTKSMRDTDVISTELSDATDGFVVTTTGGSTDFEALMRTIEGRVKDKLGEDRPIRIVAREVTAPDDTPPIAIAQGGDAR